MRLANKKGLVTAAGSGMGRAGVIRFAQEGASVAVVDIDQAAVDSTVAEIEAAGGTAFGIACDLRDDANARSVKRSKKAKDVKAGEEAAEDAALLDGDIRTYVEETLLQR